MGPVTLLTYAPQWPLLGPSAMLLATAAWRRRWAAVAVNLATAAFVIWGPMGFRWASRPAAPMQAVLRVATYNVHGRSSGFARAWAALVAQQPDVVCLEEVPQSGVSAVVRAPYRVVQHDDVAIASRLPVVRTAVVPMQAGTTRRAAVEAVLEWHSAPMTVLCVHAMPAVRPGTSLTHRGGSVAGYLAGGAAAREEQASALLTRVARASGPVVLCGDFNTPPRGLVYQRLAAALTDAFAVAGQGFGHTYPAALPQWRIDFVFAGRGLRPLAVWSPRVRTPDHPPVAADLSATGPWRSFGLLSVRRPAPRPRVGPARRGSPG